MRIPTPCAFGGKTIHNANVQEMAQLIQLYIKYLDMVEVDFKLYHNIIYIQEKLFKIFVVDIDKCQFCKL